jgi:hypothetical protein
VIVRKILGVQELTPCLPKLPASDVVLLGLGYALRAERLLKVPVHMPHVVNTLPSIKSIAHTNDFSFK